MRILLEYGPLFLVPFLAWALWLQIDRLRAEEGLPPRGWPLIRLTAAGIALVGIGLFLGSLLTGGPTQGRYIPPHLDGGQVVRGRMAPE